MLAQISLDVLRELYGELPEVRDRATFDENPHASVFDISKAARLLDWTPQHNWRASGRWQL